MSAYNFVRSKRNFTIFFCSTPKETYSSTFLYFVAIFTDSREIRGQTQKMS